MKAFIKNGEQGVVVIDLKGEVDFASAEPFRQTCIQELAQKNIVFNLRNLHFVGSDGLNFFMDTIKVLNKKSQLKFCCVSSEFRRVFANNHAMKDMDVYESEQSATAAFCLPPDNKSS